MSNFASGYIKYINHLEQINDAALARPKVMIDEVEDSYHEHLKNIAVITEAMADHAQIDIWLAFGDHIYDRAYLPICLKDIYAKLPKERIRWLATGVNKSGAPKHPLYQKNTASFIAFDMLSYMKSL